MTPVARPLRYALSHIWTRTEEDGTVTFGITNYAQYELGELQYIGLPHVGSAVKKDASFGEVESAKTVSDLYAPVSGEVVEVNESLTSSPESVNDDAYGKGWMIKIKMSNPAEADALLDLAAYTATLD